MCKVEFTLAVTGVFHWFRNKMCVKHHGQDGSPIQSNIQSIDTLLFKRFYTFIIWVTVNKDYCDWSFYFVPNILYENNGFNSIPIFMR